MVTKKIKDFEVKFYIANDGRLPSLWGILDDNRYKIGSFESAIYPTYDDLKSFKPNGAIIQIHESSPLGKEIIRRVGRYAGRRVPKGESSYISLKITADDYQKLKKDHLTLEQEQKQKQIDEFIANFKSKGIEIVFSQGISNYDGSTYALDTWTLSSADKYAISILCKYYEITMPPNMHKLYFSTEHYVRSKLYEYATTQNLFKETTGKFTGWETVTYTNKILHLTEEILQKAINILPEKKLQDLAKEKARLEELLSNEDELLENIFVSQVHVDEMNYFSKCPDTCDDCFWKDHIKAEYIEPLKFLQQDWVSTFYVKSHSGKTYTYYSPNKEVLDFLKSKFPNKIADFKKGIKAKIEQINNILSFNHNLTPTDNNTNTMFKK